MEGLFRSSREKLGNFRWISPNKQRRGRLLARLIIISAFLDAVFIFYNLWAWLSFGLTTDRLSFFMGVLGLPVLFGTWLLNRHGFSYLAALFTIILYFFRICLVSDPVRFITAFWAFIIPIMIAGFVLSPIFSFPIAGISALIYFMISNFIGVTERTDIIVFKLVLLLIFALFSYLVASHLDWAIETIDKSEAKYQSLFNNLPIGLYRTALDGKILDVNSAFLKMFGLSDLASLQKIKAEELYADPASRNQYLSIVEKTHSAEILMQRMDGSKLWVNDHVSPVYNDSGEVLYYEGSLVDISERKRAEQELELLAISDPLTGISNRRHFFAQAESIFSRPRTSLFELSVLMIDIDHFKVVNDRYGHSTGDKVLCEVARRIKMNLRSSDLLGRYGGEEFSILISRINSQEIQQVADRLRSAIADEAIKVGDYEVFITISMGVATVDAHTTSFSEALQHADQALYSAKQSGRNCWLLWHNRAQHVMPDSS
jgi:diguanylate cyclase (GGDEF)-like protein/PAS domain S-box-containing protein